LILSAGFVAGQSIAEQTKLCIFSKYFFEFVLNIFLKFSDVIYHQNPAFISVRGVEGLRVIKTLLDEF